MKLFEPGRIGKLEVKNRIIMAPMSVGGLIEPDGRLSPQGVEYFAVRAQGGVGMIEVGHVRVWREIEPQLPNLPYSRYLMADHNIYVARFSDLADRLHDYGVKLCVQLTAGHGRVATLEYLKAGGQAVAPSAQPCQARPDLMAREMTLAEIERFVQLFGMAAENLKTAGVDAIELHGHEGYLLDQFCTALWNKRTDKYGGDFAGRLRFPLEVIAAIKKAAGPDFPLIYRFGLTHLIKGGRDIPEGLEMARRLEAAGVDCLHVDAGCYENTYVPHPPPYEEPGRMVDMARMAKEAVKIPVIAVGRIGYPDLAEGIIREGKADFVALGRQLLADPEWPQKVKAGRREEICPCLADHYCLARVFQRKYIGCTTNPAAGQEKELPIGRADTVKKVLVVGGGPGGMEAARVAARRGHRVTLWEKEKMLGGKLVPASVPDFKFDYRNLIDYQSGQLQKLGVKVEMEKEADAASIQRFNPDAVIIANGGLSCPIDIPGMNGRNVMDGVDLLANRRPTGDTVLMVGGGLVGCETALYLVRQGKKVVIAEMLDTLVRDLQTANRNHLLKLLSDAGTKMLTRTTVVEITPRGGHAVDAHGGKILLAADTVVLAMGFRPNPGLFEEVKKVVAEAYAVGDCVQPRKVTEAMWEGYRAARLV